MKLYLQGEIERQRCHFEEAKQIFRNICAMKGDAVLASYGNQQLEWCTEGRSSQEVLQSPSAPADDTSVARMPLRIKYKFAVAAASRDTRDKISAWVNFPDGLMTVHDIKVLGAAVSMLDPLAGIVVSQEDVSKHLGRGDGAPGLHRIAGEDQPGPSRGWLSVICRSAVPWLPRLEQRGSQQLRSTSKPSITRVSRTGRCIASAGPIGNGGAFRSLSPDQNDEAFT